MILPCVSSWFNHFSSYEYLVNPIDLSPSKCVQRRAPVHAGPSPDVLPPVPDAVPRTFMSLAVSWMGKWWSINRIKVQTGKLWGSINWLAVLTGNIRWSINQSINQSISQSINQSIGSFVLDKSVNNKLYTWQLKWEKKDDQTTNSKLFNVKKMFPLIQ